MSSKRTFRFHALLFLWTFSLLELALSKDTKVQYVHTAFSNDPSEMSISWLTQDKTETSTVKYGRSSGHYNLSATGTALQWKSGYGWNHFAVLTDLLPQTEYFYICGDDNGGWSGEYSFVSSVVEKRAFTVGIYGDMGIDNSENTMRQVNKRSVSGQLDWIFHVGDIAYADDHVFEFQGSWNTWFQGMEETLETIPYMVCPGNHEYTSYDPFLYFYTRNYVVYNQRFHMPNANNESESMYYSFDYSNVHFVVWSTESSFSGAPHKSDDEFGDQMAWLEADLMEANLPENRAQRPWVIVMGHRPIYSSGTGYSKNGIPINSDVHPSNSHTLQVLFEDLFYKYQVDIVFNGHVHSYERNYPTYKNEKMSDNYTNPPSPFNIVLGNAGNIEMLETDWTDQPQWSAFRYSDDYGYGILNVINDTHLTWEFHRATDDVIQDQVTVIKT